MGVFVRLIIDYGICKGMDCGICIDACPVSIFLKKSDTVGVDPEKEDECTFCEVCLERCPGKCIQIEKRY
ncbi:MAG: ferredoxin [Deltaproteobacteria bacterium]|nr:ferredoxin [Deltaproteobacteria bacterium]